jgi:3'-phosphoadenosine 5'-phosphosulfate sulfotransferase (PAPS reductase)/FAD synthetase
LEVEVKHVVGLSGGIDSQAVSLWVRNRYGTEDVILLNSNAGGNEHPLTVAHIQQYSRDVHPVVVIRPELQDLWKTEGFAETKGLDSHEPLTFPRLAELKKRFPARKSQFCTYFLKIAPTVRWIQENLAGEEYIRYSGVRRDESEKRSDTPFQAWDDTFDCEVIHPIADWTKQMCFDYVKAHKEEYNPLYALGFERVGCAPCVNSGKEDIRRWADRFPEMIAKVRSWELRVGKTFFPPVIKSGIPNWIDEVVAWSRTDHGGIQFNILKSAEFERPSCESKFGLCE